MVSKSVDLIEIKPFRRFMTERLYSGNIAAGARRVTKRLWRSTHSQLL